MKNYLVLSAVSYLRGWRFSRATVTQKLKKRNTLKIFWKNLERSFDGNGLKNGKMVMNLWNSANNVKILLGYTINKELHCGLSSLGLTDQLFPKYPPFYVVTITNALLYHFVLISHPSRLLHRLCVKEALTLLGP